MQQIDSVEAGDRDFELELRRAIDRKYEREPAANNFILRLIGGELTRDECRDVYLGQWESIMAFNRVLLPRLLERAPDVSTRAQLMHVIAQEYGPDIEHAHPYLFAKFLLALGADERDLRWETDLERGTARDEVALLRGSSFCELLARMLVGESLGPVVFPAVASALERTLGLSRASVRYFKLHAITDKKDTEILFTQLRRAATTRSDQLAALRMIDRSFESGRYLMYGCRLPGTQEYRFAARPKRRVGSSS